MDSKLHYSPPAAISPLDLGRILWRRLWVIALILTLCVGSAYVVSKRTPKRWRATAQMVVIQRAAPLVASTQGGSSGPLIESTDTQVAMLQSNAMAKRTVDWMRNLALDPERAREFARQPESFRQLAEEYVRLSAPERQRAADELQQAITAAASKDTNLLNVSVEANSLERAITLANAICKTFVEWKKDLSQQSYKETMESLERRARRARAQMVEAERLETAFKQQHQLVDVSAQEKAALDRYLARDAEVGAIKQDLIAQQVNLKALGSRLQNVAAEIRNGTGVRDDALVMGLQQQLNQQEIAFANDRLTFTMDYPGMREKEIAIQQLRERLDKAVRDTLDNKKPSLQTQGQLFEQYKQAQVNVLLTQAKLAAAVSLRDQLKRQTQQWPQASMEYARLAQNAAMARSLYTSLQSALNAARVDVDTAGSNVAIAQEAYGPEQPFRPNRARDLMFGGALGLLLALVAVFVLEQSDRRVRSIEDIRRVVPGPIVGALPRMSRAQLRGLLQGAPPPQAQEAYSLARANLSLALRAAALEDPERHPVILITSALPGEGKSVSAASLARAIARSGKRVILVDADLRRPAQARLFRTEASHGLAEVLTGSRILEEALTSSDTPNLTLLHSGTAPCNPTDLVSQPQMAALLDQLRRLADVVIVDAPACSVVADALFLAPYADCIFHVIGAGQTDADIVRDTTAALHAATPRTMVFFVNRAPKDRGHAYKHYYAYAGGPRNSERALEE